MDGMSAGNPCPSVKTHRPVGECEDGKKLGRIAVASFILLLSIQGSEILLPIDCEASQTRPLRRDDLAASPAAEGSAAENRTCPQSLAS